MALTTPRFALPYPVAGDANNVPADLLALATRLDNIVMTFGQGTLASRPAAGTAGRVWLATDTKDVSFDTGAVWRSLTGLPTIPMARYYLTTAAVAAGSAGVAIPFNATSYNRNGFSSIATPTTAIPIPVTGYYRCRMCARHNFGASTADVAVQQSILKNATPFAFKQESGVWEATLDNDITVSIEARSQFTAGDTVTFKTGASPGNTLYNTADTTYCEIELLNVS